MSQITLNKLGNKFLIANSVKTNAVVSELPMVRFLKSSNVWVLPISISSCKDVANLIKSKRFTITEQVASVIHGKLSIDPTKMKRSPPSEYIPKMPNQPVQQACYNYLWGLDHFSLACDVGLGKAKMIIDIASMLWMEGKIKGALILMPPSITISFSRELVKHCNVPFKSVILEYTTISAVSEFNSVVESGFDGLTFVVMSMSKLWKLSSHSTGVYRGRGVPMAEEFLKSRPCMMAIDESHGIMNPDSLQTQNSLYLGQFAKHRLISSGTQTSTSLLNVYSQYQFLSPDIIGVSSIQEFKSRYCVFGGYKNKEVVSYKNVDDVMNSIIPYTFVARREDWLVLPELTVERAYVDPIKEQLDEISSIVLSRNNLLKDISKMKDHEVDGVLSKASSAIQLVSGGFRTIEDVHPVTGVITRRYEQICEIPTSIPKVAMLLDILSDMRNTKVILWVHFKVEQEMLNTVLTERGFNNIWLKSGMSSIAKDKAISEFAHGKTNILLAHQMVAGTGLTINEAKVAIWYSTPRDPISRTQAKGRNYRYGQTDGVLHLDLLTTKTYDKKILDSLESHIDFDKSLKAAILAGDSDLLDI